MYGDEAGAVAPKDSKLRGGGSALCWGRWKNTGSALGWIPHPPCSRCAEVLSCSCRISLVSALSSTTREGGGTQSGAEGDVEPERSCSRGLSRSPGALWSWVGSSTVLSWHKGGLTLVTLQKSVIDQKKVNWTSIKLKTFFASNNTIQKVKDNPQNRKHLQIVYLIKI